MNVIEVTERIKAIDLFKDLKLSEPSVDSQFGTITVPNRDRKSVV